MNLKDQGVTLLVNGKEIEEVIEFSYEIRRPSTPLYQMGSPDPRSFSRGSSIPPSVSVRLSHIANRYKDLSYGNMTARYSNIDHLISTNDSMLIQVVRDGNRATLEISDLVLTHFDTKPVKDRPDDLEWNLRFYGHLRDQKSMPDAETGSNEQLLSMLRTFDDDPLEMEL